LCRTLSIDNDVETSNDEKNAAVDVVRMGVTMSSPTKVIALPEDEEIDGNVVLPVMTAVVVIVAGVVVVAVVVVIIIIIIRLLRSFRGRSEMFLGGERLAIEPRSVLSSDVLMVVAAVVEVVVVVAGKATIPFPPSPTTPTLP
jgi:hypothetical protein